MSKNAGQGANVGNIKQDKETFKANLNIQERFYGEKQIEDDIDTHLSNNHNIGAVILPENNEKK